MLLPFPSTSWVVTSLVAGLGPVKRFPELKLIITWTLACVCSLFIGCFIGHVRVLANPSLAHIDSCHEEDLAQIATHFRILYSKSILKELKALVMSKLVEMKTMLPVQSERGAVNGSIRVRCARGRGSDH